MKGVIKVKENSYPAYYGILTANVRYNDQLSMSEKVMFTEITALSNANGYCSARNKYFAELYDKSEKTISLWIKHLKDCGFIHIEYKRRGAEVVLRKIYPTPEHELQKCKSTNYKNVTGTDYKNVKENNTSINNTSTNKSSSSTVRDSLDNSTKDIESRQNAFELYQITVGVLTPTQNQILSEYIQNLSDEVVQFAINSMANQTERRSFNYLNKILMRYEQLGIHTVEQAEKLEKQHQESLKRVRPKQKKKSKRRNTLPF